MAGGFFRRFTKRFFVLCNIGAALLFLLGCYAYLFDPKYFWFFGLLTLAALYLLLVLLIFIVFWLVANARYIFISIIAILLAWGPLYHLIKFRKATEVMAPKPATDVRVMSWNVEHFDILEHKKHPERKEQMIDLINKYEPDIACFQEMVGGDRDSTAINYVPAMARQLHFPGYYYTYSEEDNFDDKHHFGIIIFSRYPIVNKKSITTERNYNSQFQYIDIVKETDTFRVFNIHLQSLKFSEASRQYLDDPTLESKVDLEKSKGIISKLKRGFLQRKLQSEAIKIAMNESPYPVIVCGDFNDVANSYAYKMIGKGMKNAFAEKGSGLGRTFSDISPTLRIDNIFSDNRFEVEQYVRVKKKLSDHYPIIADLRFVADK